MNPFVHIIELHLTNRCNLADLNPCLGECTYRSLHADAAVLPFDALEHVAKLRPSFVFISGGGEPTLYHNKDRLFVDAIRRLRQLLPESILVLTTNGVYLPQKNWQTMFAAISISLHGYDSKSFEINRPTHVMEIWNNIWRYFDSGVGEIWVKFRVTRKTYLDAVDLAERLWYEWSHRCAGKNPQSEDCHFKSESGMENLLERRRKTRFGFKMLYLADDDRPGDQFWRSEPDRVSQQHWSQRIESLKSGPSLFGRFLRNVSDRHHESHFSLPSEFISGKLETHHLNGKGSCIYARDYVLVSAPGKLYPCCAMVATDGFSYGTISQTPEDLMRKRLILSKCAPTDYCAKGCRLASTLVGKMFNDRYETTRFWTQ